MLDVVDEAECLFARGLHRLETLLEGKFDDVQIEVVAVDGPVDHEFAAGHAPVVEHELRGDRLSGRRLARPGELRRVVPFGTRDRAVGPGAVVLEDRHDGQILHDVVCLFGGQRLARFGPGVHAHTIGGAAQRQGVAEVCGVDRHARSHGQPATLRADELRAQDAVVAPEDLFEAVSAQHLKHRFGSRHGPEDAVCHMGLEKRRTHPPRSHGLRTAVMAADRLAELVPQPRREIGIAVGRPHTLRRKHAAQHGRRLHHKGRDALTGRRNGCRRSGSRCPDDQHVDLALLPATPRRLQDDEQHRRQQRRKGSCTFHAPARLPAASRRSHSHSLRICQIWNNPRGTWKQPFHLPPLRGSSTSPRRFR